MNYDLKKIRVIVIEDEKDPCEWLCGRISEFKEFELIGSVGKVDEAYSLIVQTKPDAIFLDNKLIGGNGISILERLKNNHQPIPQIIVTTAVKEYAIEYLNNWGDYCKKYLLKPYGSEWEKKLRACIDILLPSIVSNESSNHQNQETKDYTFLKEKGGMQKVSFDEIIWVQVLKNVGVELILNDKIVTSTHSLSKSLLSLPNNFIQISRFIVINSDKIVGLDSTNQKVFVDYKGQSHELTFSPNYKQSIIDRLPTFGG